MTPNKGGRPPTPPHLKRRPVPLRLAEWVAAAIDKMEGTRADNIERALIRFYRLKQPKE